MPVTKWNPTRPEVRARIIRVLADNKSQPELWKRKSWAELWEGVKGTVGSKTTLSVYLQGLHDEGHINKETEGRKTYYSLVNTEEVERILVGVSHGNVRPYGTVDLSKLNEEEFVRIIHCALGTGLSVILHDYILIGEQMLSGKEEAKAFEDVKPFLNIHYSNLYHVLDFCSRVMAKRIEDSSLQVDRIWKAKQAVSKERKMESLKVAKSQNMKMEEGTPKITFADVQLNKKRKLKATDLGLKKIYGAILESKKKEAVTLASLVETSQ